MRQKSILISLVILGILIYSNTFSVPFYFDDKTFIIENLSLRNIGNIYDIWAYFPTRFITFFTFALNYHFHKLNVFGYHLVNLVIHIGSSFLAGWLARLILKTSAIREDILSKRPNIISMFVSLIFLTHPIQTQAVTHIYQRCASLTGFLYIFSVCLYLKSRLVQVEGNTANKINIFYIICWAMSIVTILSKENAFTLPFMFILCELYFFKTPGQKWNKTCLYFLILLPVIPVLLFITKPVTAGDVEWLFARPSMGALYFLTEIRVLATYLRLLILPINQNLDYDYELTNNLMDTGFLGSFFILAVIIIAAVQLYKKHRLISFGMFWFFLTLIPESSFIPLRDVIFEHRLYLPMIGFSLFLTGALYSLKSEKIIKIMPVLFALVIMCYSILTYERNKVWGDELNLWNDNVKKSPNKARPYKNRGMAHEAKGDLDSAISDYNKAIEIDPRYAGAYNNRGIIYAQKGNNGQAMSDFDQAIAIIPDFAKCYNNRGITYQRKNELDKAIADYDKALSIVPVYADAYNNRGIAYEAKGDLKKAIDDYTKALEINPEFTQSLFNRGCAHLSMGDLDNAIVDFSNAIAIDPQYAEAYSNRANAYFQKDDYNKSLEDIVKAQTLGHKVSPEFLRELKKAIGELP